MNRARSELRRASAKRPHNKARRRDARTEQLEPRRLLAGNPISFAPAQLYDHAASMIATADLNHDGHVDVVAVNPSHDTIDVCLNRGDGTLSTPPIQYFQNDARWVAIADFNGDGIPDLAVTSPNNIDGRNEIHFYYGVGNGAFSTPPVTVFTGRPAIQVNAADVNGDGLPDLILTNHSRVSVMINLGAGKFAPAVFYPAGPDVARSVVVGDFNKDGAPDVAVVRNDRRVEVLLGQKNAQGVPTGAFGPPVVVSQTSVEPTYGIAGDFNGDGNLDIAVVNSEFRVAPITVLLGNGDGTFQPKRSLFGGNFVDAIASADLNGDGIPDLITSSFTSNMRVYAGNGDGTFGPEASYIGGRFGEFVTTADLNGDGLPDVIVGLGPFFRVLMNTSNVTPPPTTTPASLTATLSSNHSLIFTNSSGFLTTVSLKGPGSAQVQFGGVDLAQNGSTVSGTDISVDSVTISGTNSGSSLVVRTQGKNSTVEIGAITDGSSIGSIDAPTALLRGNINIAGNVGRIDLDTATDDTIMVGAAGSNAPLTLNVVRADGLTLNSSQPVAAVNAGQWISSDGTAAAINAPSVGAIHTQVSFSANLDVTGGLGAFDASQVTRGTWTIGQGIGSITLRHNATFTINAASLGRLAMGGALIGSTVAITGNIGSVTTTGMFNTVVAAGVLILNGGGTELLTFPPSVVPASLGSVAVHRTHAGASFINSLVVATNIRSADLGTIQMANNGTPFGIDTSQITRLTVQDSVTHKVVTIPVSTLSTSASAYLAQKGINPQDFAVRLFAVST